MSNYKEGQPVQTPLGPGKVATDQAGEQVYVLLTDTGSLESFLPGELQPDDVPETAQLNPADAESFDFDNFLDEENSRPKEDY